MGPVGSSELSETGTNRDSLLTTADQGDVRGACAVFPQKPDGTTDAAETGKDAETSTFSQTFTLYENTDRVYEQSFDMSKDTIATAALDVDQDVNLKTKTGLSASVGARASDGVTVHPDDATTFNSGVDVCARNEVRLGSDSAASASGSATVGAHASLRKELGSDYNDTTVEIGASGRMGVEREVGVDLNDLSKGVTVKPLALIEEAKIHGSVTTRLDEGVRGGVHGSAGLCVLGYTIDVGAHGEVKKVSLLENSTTSGSGTVNTLNGCLQGGEIKFRKDCKGYLWDESTETEIGFSLKDGLRFKVNEKGWKVSENVKKIGRDAGSEAVFCAIDILVPEGVDATSVAERLQRGAETVTVNVVCTFGGEAASRMFPEVTALAMDHASIIMGALSKAGSAETLIAHSKQVLLDQSAQAVMFKTESESSSFQVDANARLVVTEKSDNARLKHAVGAAISGDGVSGLSPYGVHIEAGVRGAGEYTVNDDVVVGADVGAKVVNGVVMGDVGAHAKVRMVNSWTNTTTNKVSGNVQFVPGTAVPVQTTVAREKREHHMFSRESLAHTGTVGLKNGVHYQATESTVNLLQDVTKMSSCGVGWGGVNVSQTVLSRGIFVDSRSESSLSWREGSWQEKTDYHLNQNSFTLGEEAVKQSVLELICAFESEDKFTLQRVRNLVCNVMKRTSSTGTFLVGATLANRVAPNLTTSAFGVVGKAAPIGRALGMVGSVVEGAKTYQHNREAVGAEQANKQLGKDLAVSAVMSAAGTAIATATGSYGAAVVAGEAMKAISRKASGANKDGEIEVKERDPGPSEEQEDFMRRGMEHNRNQSNAASSGGNAGSSNGIKFQIPIGKSASSASKEQEDFVRRGVVNSGDRERQRTAAMNASVAVDSQSPGFFGFFQTRAATSRTVGGAQVASAEELRAARMKRFVEGPQ